MILSFEILGIRSSDRISQDYHDQDGKNLIICHCYNIFFFHFYEHEEIMIDENFCQIMREDQRNKSFALVKEERKEKNYSQMFLDHKLIDLHFPSFNGKLTEK